MRLEAALLTAPNDEETNVIREKTRLAKGVLYWRLAESFKARVWNERRTLKDLDQALREAQNRWVRVQKARSSMPNNTGEFAARVAALRARLDAAQTRLADVAKQQNGLLESLARDELEQQKERISTYQIQARFALAAIYDRAAAPPAAAPSSAPQESQGELETVPGEGRRDGGTRRRWMAPPPTARHRLRKPPPAHRSARGAAMSQRAANKLLAAVVVAALCAGVAFDAAAAAKKKEKTIGELQCAPGGRAARPEGGSHRASAPWKTTGASSSCRRPIRSCAPKRCAASPTSTWKRARATAWPARRR